MVWYGRRRSGRCDTWFGMVVVVVDVVTHGLVWSGPVFVEGCRWWTMVDMVGHGGRPLMVDCYSVFVVRLVSSILVILFLVPIVSTDRNYSRL